MTQLVLTVCLLLAHGATGACHDEPQAAGMMPTMCGMAGQTQAFQREAMDPKVRVTRWRCEDPARAKAPA